MKSTILIVLSLSATTGYTQVFSDNVRVICPCEMYKVMLNPALRSSFDVQPYIIAPSCNIHKPLEQASPEGYYLFKKRKKTIVKSKKGSHVIWL